ncbi:uncharacterized protein DNG_00437 [Cephalotrichum gorgonifer]|uniref:Uncharacterized protein n=1 Tax=Cephalotrichum gorgonifer TaxID=2041049 RepID=A0AAE8SR86_9PEZI|nr:uncharacterized protein DNG_00437 [Cephalotrichum gorgonifer]
MSNTELTSSSKWATRAARRPLACSVLATPQRGPPFAVPFATPPTSPGSGRSLPIPLPSPPSRPGRVPPPFSTTLTSAPQPPPADQHSTDKDSGGSSDGSITDSTSVTTVDEIPTTPTTGVDLKPDTTDTSGTPTDTNDDMEPIGTKGAGSDDRTLVITLSTVLSVVAALLIVATVFACFRVKKGRMPFARRGISPIDDEEIESWKRNTNEKYTSGPASTRDLTSKSYPGSLKKSPSVIVYHNPSSPTSRPEDSSGSAHSHNHSQSFSHRHTISNGSLRQSLDFLPQAPVLARAPNSRPGLTDETIEGDEAFVPNHRRHTSRLSKKHSRSRSSSSYQWPGYPSSEPRQSGDYPPRTSYSYDRKGDWTPTHPHNGTQEVGASRGPSHTRIYSDSSMPPRISFDEELLGGLSPRPLLRGTARTPDSQIGRAIG